MIARRPSLSHIPRTLILAVLIAPALLAFPATASAGKAGPPPRVTITSPHGGLQVEVGQLGVFSTGNADAVVVGNLEFRAHATSKVGLRSCSMQAAGGPYVFVGYEATTVQMSNRRHRCDLTGNPHGWGLGTLEVSATDVLGRTVTVRQDFYHVTLVPQSPD